MKEKVEAIMRKTKDGLTQTDYEIYDCMVTMCFFTGESCKIICGLGKPDEQHVDNKQIEEEIPCTAQDFVKFAKECRKDEKWHVDKWIMWSHAILYCVEYF